MRQITCPICKTLPQSPPKALSTHLCTSCGLCWTYLPDEVDSKALYADEVYAVVDNRRSLFERVIFSEARKVLRKSRKLNPHADTLLDFGCGKGQFLAVAKELGWTGLGIETASERADFARKKYRAKVLGEYYNGGIIQGGGFDLITLNHVLEHLPHPIELTEELCAQNLASDGLLYLEVPRADSWQAKIAGKNWMHWDIPKHLTHWTETGLEREFSKIGYRKVDSRRFSVHLGVLGMLQALLSKIGYNKNLILQLKHKKSAGLMLLVAIVLPLAWTMEWVSTLANKSGIIGIYMKKNG